MLDDLKYIHQIDSDDALGVIEKQWQQLNQTYDVDLSRIDKDSLQNIVWAGMGGSAIPAQTSLSIMEYSIPFEIKRDYDIPAYVNEKTLFISSSYSGNTEETLEALAKAEAKNAQIIVVTAGGKLQAIAKEKGYPCYIIPSGTQPRMTTLFFLKAMAHIYDTLGITHNLGQQLTEQSSKIEEAVKRWLPTVPTLHNEAKQLAQEIIGKSAVIYGGPKTQAVANKFKIGLNENAKHVAWWNQLPEFNHNEFIGWSEQPTDKPYTVINIRSSFEHPRVLKRFDVTERLLSGRRPAAHNINLQGETLIEQILFGMVFCDFVSLYVALLNGVDPTPVDLVESFKAALNE